MIFFSPRQVSKGWWNVTISKWTVSEFDFRINGVFFGYSQMVARIVQELFRTAPADVLAEEIPNIMTIVRNLGEKDGE
jgi:hypothetical protein